MIKLSQILSFFLPLTAFITIGQIHQPQQQIFAALFVAISALICARIKNQMDVITILRKSYRGGLSLLALFVCLCAFFPVGGQLSLPLLIEHSPENAQAIFVLASGATLAGGPGFSGLQRVNHGIKLLQQGRAPHLYISTGFSERSQHAEARWVASYTSMFNIPAASYTLLISRDIVTTSTEAQYAHKILSQQNVKDILLVTSGAHIFRTIATFKKAGFASIKPAPTHDRNNIFYANESYLSSFHAAIHEWIGLAWYWSRNRI